MASLMFYALVILAMVASSMALSNGNQGCTTAKQDPLFLNSKLEEKEIEGEISFSGRGRSYDSLIPCHRDVCAVKTCKQKFIIEKEMEDVEQEEENIKNIEENRWNNPDDLTKMKELEKRKAELDKRKEELDKRKEELKNKTDQMVEDELKRICCCMIRNCNPDQAKVDEWAAKYDECKSCTNWLLIGGIIAVIAFVAIFMVVLLVVLFTMKKKSPPNK